MLSYVSQMTQAIDALIVRLLWVVSRVASQSFLDVMASGANRFPQRCPWWQGAVLRRVADTLRFSLLGSARTRL